MRASLTRVTIAAPRSPALAALLVGVAFLVALTLPDADLVLGIGHRSAVTHSVLPAVLATIRRAWRDVACGTAAGIGLHLAADAFPDAMTGFATVKLPFAGALPPAESYGWLVVNAVLALTLAAWLLPRLHSPRAALLLTAGAAIAGAAYLWRTDGGWPVLAIAAALCITILWRRRRV